jgi:hypothetical protein
VSLSGSKIFLWSQTVLKGSLKSRVSSRSSTADGVSSNHLDLQGEGPGLLKILILACQSVSYTSQPKYNITKGFPQGMGVTVNHRPPPFEPAPTSISPTGCPSWLHCEWMKPNIWFHCVKEGQGELAPPFVLGYFTFLSQAS